MANGVTLRALQDDKYTLIQNDRDLSALLDYCGIPTEYREDITAAVVEVLDGDYGEVWLTESSERYNLSAWYHPIKYYLD